MSKIHPTAIIDAGAVIGDDVEIGPYCIIGAGVELGEGCWLQNHVTLQGPTKIGPHNKFYQSAAIGQQTQDLKYKEEPTYLEIGSHNTFREFATVHRATSAGDKTIIGSHNNFLAYSHVGHDCIVGNHVIFSNNGTVGGHVIVEDYAIISGLSAVHQFCRIGRLSFIGGCAKIVQDVPPFCIADGNPGRARGLNFVGLQRAGLDESSIKALRQAYRTFYRSGLNATQALEKIEGAAMTPEVAAFADFAKSTKRGLIPAGKAQDEE
ncbi:MAG: acyl-ACP--UDP-N-acetylglucosamine O-acyltransferase [Verrucomicrobiales bacterium]|nr:acyl-ACP--UDP-N-acetylglucosamine O-acyltransferase [Verrucomicrobiales bacterium]MCP5557013.1 acyl-ACP--UDP-N-acetylglucosamine O-acyltransferase [Verrucomicrobiaceae bacterium]